MGYRLLSIYYVLLSFLYFHRKNFKFSIDNFFFLVYNLKCRLKFLFIGGFMVFRFYYRDLFRLDVKADTYTDALRILSNSTRTVFGIHPLDFDDYDLI